VRDFSEHGGDAIRVEELVAPSLDWKTLQFRSYKNGTMVEVRTVDALAQGEPAPGLFSVPSSAAVVSSSAQFVRGFEERRGRSLTPGFQAFLEKQEAKNTKPR
jgi:hypothetical protein